MTEAQRRGIVKRIVNALRMADDEKQAALCLSEALRELDTDEDEFGNEAEFGKRTYIGLMAAVRESYVLAAFEGIGAVDGNPMSSGANLGKLMAAYGRGYGRSQERAENGRRTR